ncbi:MAG: GTP 3',8-cyclase MoaA [Promethearchaeota archaeon]
MEICDGYGRPIVDIRVSITQHCNLNCIYCHHEGYHERSNSVKRDEMTAEEIQRLVSVSQRVGIKRVKITGGEPLLRHDIFEIISRLSKLEGINEVSLVTNGVLLDQDTCDKLKHAGLKRINISLDTLDRVSYFNITRKNVLNKVLEGIKNAQNSGLNPIKINTVLLKGINDTEIQEFIEFAMKTGIILQLIELMTFDENNDNFFNKYHVDPSPIEEVLKGIAEYVEVRQMQQRKRYHLNDGTIIEIVHPMHNSAFCANCKRLRVTSDGHLKPCLMREDNLIDIVTPIRKNVSDEELYQLFLQAIALREPFFKE